MNKQLVVVATAVVSVVVFVVAAVIFAGSRPGPAPSPAQPPDQAALVRPHSPIIGPVGAPVTVVEFFDPSCEACRAFHPIVKQILGQFPSDVRLVLRYTPFHQGSDEVVRILEASRAQGKFEAVLDALFDKQGEWAIHGAPDLERAWAIAGEAGIDLVAAKAAAKSPEIESVLKQDVADVTAMAVEKTPTFFVNGKRLTEFGPDQLLALVQSEVDQAKAPPQ
jgi:protein-disulfide isomerase